VRRSRAAACAAALLWALLAAPFAQADFIEAIEHPTRVPHFDFISLGDGIPPGSSGVYGFALKNRYNASIDNLSLTVEIYRWATVEETRNASEVGSGPVFARTGSRVATVTVPRVAANASVDVRLEVQSRADSPDGVYFTRHLLEFDYGNVTEPPAVTPYTQHFVMKSKGHFTAEEFASLNYSDLRASLEALNISGVIPDSSFSVKRPAPLWPLAVLIGAAAVAGTLALAYYLADQSPGRHPRLEGGLLRWEGKLHVWRALAREELRARLARRKKK